MRVNAASPNFTSQSPTLHVFKSEMSSGGSVSLSKSSSRGGLLMRLVTRKLSPFSNDSMSLTAAT